MARARWAIRGSGRLAGLLVAVTVPPLVVLVWLGLLLVGDDRQRMADRIREERLFALRTVAQALDRSLLDLERHFDAETNLPDGLVRLEVSGAGIDAEPGDRLLWVTVATPVVEPDVFRAGERAEYAGHTAAAVWAYTALVRAPDPDVRAGATLRLGRIRMRARQWDQALDLYRQVADLSGAQAAGAPADLQARRRICLVLERAGRTEDLAAEAAALRADFERGLWALDRAAWELTAEDVGRWTGSPLDRDPSRLLMSQAAERLSFETPAVTRRLFVVDDQPVTALVRGDRGELRALLMTPALLASIQAAAVASAAGPTTGQVFLLGDLGESLGAVMSGDPGGTLSLASSDTGLPWTVVLGPEDAAVITERLGQRRWLLMSGFSAVLVFVAGAGIFLWRLVRREAAVRRLEQEFIAAVSHEFRTPLTSLRLAWEVLDGDREAPVEQRRALYGSIGRNSERLQRLVESLLDFSRMESGRRFYRLVPTDVSALVHQVVADFRRQHAESTTDVRVTAPTDPSCVVSADGAALGHALWNLLDNALKYSPADRRIEVAVEQDADVVRLSVTDRGTGIPKAEQGAIFGRFVRGQRAQRDGVSGTGLGLAIVAHVIEAHRGSVSVTSEVDRGSTFTMTLPLVGGETGHAEALHAHGDP